MKCYLAVFVCLEAVTGLSTKDFLQALKRFISRRGSPSVMFSDNGTNFIGACKQLRQFYKSLKEDEQHIIDYLAPKQISWQFIPARSPHWGGLWEAAVKSAKHYMTTVIGNTNLSLEAFNTVIIEIEAVINSRPLCPMSHFLIGSSLPSLPVKDLTAVPLNRLSRWQRCAQLKQGFWKRWSSDYLSSLQMRKNDEQENLKIGDLVLVRDESNPPLLWPISRVLEVYPGSDSKVRVVKIRTAKGVFSRSITKLCPLPDSVV